MVPLASSLASALSASASQENGCLFARWNAASIVARSLSSLAGRLASNVAARAPEWMATNRSMMGSASAEPGRRTMNGSS